MGTLMELPVFYITEEGGLYHKWEPRIRGIKVFALFFADGSVFDSYVGWRTVDFSEVKAAYERAQERVGTMDV